MNKRLSAIILGVGVALVFSCSGKDRDGEVIHFWQFWDVAFVEPLVREFEAKHPGVRVEIEQLTWKSGLEKIQAAVASGTQPDLCELGSTWVPRFSYEGVLEDLTAVYNEIADSFLMWESAMWKGRVYGLPWVQGSRVLFYNKSLFRSAGLDPEEPPRTWKDLLDAAKRIHALGTDIHGFGLNLGERYVLYKKFMAFAWGNGGRILGDDGSVLFDSPENLEALEFYLELADYSLKEKQEVLDHYFKSGKLGIQISGAWNLRNYSIEAPGLEYGVALVPKPSEEKGVHASFAGAEILIVFKNSKKKESALELARFLHDYPRARALSVSEQSVFPAAKRALSDSTFLRDAKRRVFVEQAFTSRSAPAHPGWIEMEDLINRSLEEVLYGRKEPAGALKKAAAGVKAIVTKYE
ncbi:MAG: extracellular solute-binding protein [Candidatus Latescibacteria bacterium]|nr:extracellular solute-binding protein [Candidatus Latescibacterota bacterium]NIM22222.1 extracellular solute-binding protein [Candidatus Latescibacterota bacterium]NIM66261.1 extracellular solute-binding protein [Candidatus Latescibacterota bacterium]NIO02338.1 extracellular solute-binding protein [Candidatus Latescibacterota bacterium]NIO29869.1 extracellular solute-binding protein [Candidatus Latescibacterota bacterium]